MDGYNNKVDMSLDEIIKLNKKEKKQASVPTGGAGKRGGKINRRGRGRGNYAGRGRGRGGGQQGPVAAQNVVSTKRNNMQGVKANRRGRGGANIARGRGRGLISAQKWNAGGASPLNRKKTSVKTARGRGRGQMVFTNSKLTNNAPFQQNQRRQRLDAVKAQANLLRSHDFAVKKLEKAKKSVQRFNNALNKKAARDNVVNARRGIVNDTTQVVTSKPGRRKLLTALMSQNFKGSNVSLASNASGRQMINTSVTITNQQAANRNRKRFRNPRQNSNVSIQVSNPASQSYKPPVQQPKPIIEQLKLLKPAVPTVYKFQKNVFSTSSTTTVSLNDRFSSSSTSLSSPSDNGERKVFI